MIPGFTTPRRSCLAIARIVLFTDPCVVQAIWRAHFEFTGINTEPIIVRKKIEERCVLRAFASLLFACLRMLVLLTVGVAAGLLVAPFVAQAVTGHLHAPRSLADVTSTLRRVSARFIGTPNTRRNRWSTGP